MKLDSSVVTSIFFLAKNLGLIPSQDKQLTAINNSSIMGSSAYDFHKYRTCIWYTYMHASLILIHRKKGGRTQKEKKILTETFLRAGLSTDRPTKKPHSPQN